MKFIGKRDLIFVIFLIIIIFALFPAVNAFDDYNGTYDDSYYSITSSSSDAFLIEDSNCNLDDRSLGSGVILDDYLASEMHLNETHNSNDSNDDSYSYLLNYEINKAKLKSSSFHYVSEDSFNDYFNSDNTLNSIVVDNDTLVFNGLFLNKGIIYIDKSINIIGQDATFKNASFYIRHSDVSIENLTILNEYDYLNDSSDSGDSDSRDFNLSYDNSSYSWAIYAYESDKIRLVGNNIKVIWPNRAYGIYLFDSRFNTIENNRIYVEGEGLSYGIVSYECYDSSFANNKITAIGTSEVYGYEGRARIDDDITLLEMFRTYAIVVIYSSNNLISNNSAYLSSNIPEGNYTIRNCTNTLFGISVFHGSNNNLLESNSVHIEAYDPFIYGMGVVGTTYDRDSPSSCNNSFIKNTILLNGTYFASGIMVGNQAVNSVLENNTMNLYSQNYTYGITLEQSRSSRLSYNHINEYGMSNYGVEFFSSSNNTLISNYISGSGEFSESVGFINSLENNVSGNTLISNGSYSHPSAKIVSAINSSVFSYYGTFAKWFNSLSKRDNSFIKAWILNGTYKNYASTIKSTGTNGNQSVKIISNVSLLKLSKWLNSLNKTDKDFIALWVKSPNMTEVIRKPSPHIQNEVMPDAVALWNVPVWLGPGSSQNSFYNNTFVSDNPNHILRAPNSNGNHFGGNDFISAKDYGDYYRNHNSNSDKSNANSGNGQGHHGSSNNQNVNGSNDSTIHDNSNIQANGGDYTSDFNYVSQGDIGGITHGEGSDGVLKASYLENVAYKSNDEQSYIFVLFLVLVFFVSFLKGRYDED